MAQSISFYGEYKNAAQWSNFYCKANDDQIKIINGRLRLLNKSARQERREKERCGFNDNKKGGEDYIT